MLDDGHVEFTHDCRDGQLVGVLRSPPWLVVKSDPLTVEPSVSCQVCGLHGWIGGLRWTVDAIDPAEHRSVIWVPSASAC